MVLFLERSDINGDSQIVNKFYLKMVGDQNCQNASHLDFLSILNDGDFSKVHQNQGVTLFKSKGLYSCLEIYFLLFVEKDCGSPTFFQNALASSNFFWKLPFERNHPKMDLQEFLFG
jgi:hypothetical protein